MITCLRFFNCLLQKLARVQSAIEIFFSLQCFYSAPDRRIEAIEGVTRNSVTLVFVKKLMCIKALHLNFCDFCVGGDEARQAASRVTAKTVSQTT